MVFEFIFNDIASWRSGIKKGLYGIDNLLRVIFTTFIVYLSLS